MTSTLRVPLRIEIEVVVHEIEGGGFWGETPLFPGCLAQADTLEELRTNILRALEDWCAEPGVMREHVARELAAIQGSREIPSGPYPLRYDYRPPPSWTEEDENG